MKIGGHVDIEEEGDNHTVVVTTGDGSRVEISREDVETALDAARESDEIPTDAVDEFATRAGLTLDCVLDRLTGD